MGIRPSGLGLRLISPQLQPRAEAGDRCPFVSLPFGVKSPASFFFAGVKPLILRCFNGLRLLVLALLRSAKVSSSGSASCSSLIAPCAARLFFFADLVTGPKYPSFCSALSVVSEGVGLGEMTRGVAGTPLREESMKKVGKQGLRIAPVSALSRSPATGMNQEGEPARRRCRSLRDERVSISEAEARPQESRRGESGREAEVMGSAGMEEADEVCAAFLGGGMMPLWVPWNWHGELLCNVQGDEFFFGGLWCYR